MVIQFIIFLFWFLVCFLFYQLLFLTVLRNVKGVKKNKKKNTHTQKSAYTGLESISLNEMAHFGL